MDIDTEFLFGTPKDSKAFLPTNVPFDQSYMGAASQMALPYQDFAAELGYGGDPKKIQGIGSDVRHTVGSAKGKFAVQDYLAENLAIPRDSKLSNIIGDAAIIGSTAFQEIPDMIKNIPEGGINFFRQPIEDIRANFRAVGIPYGTSDAELLQYAVDKSPSKDMIEKAKDAPGLPMNMIRSNRFPPNLAFPPQPDRNYQYGTVKADDIIFNPARGDFIRAPNEAFQQILDEEYEKGEMMENVADAPRDSLFQKFLDFLPFGEKSLSGILLNALQSGKKGITNFRDAIGRRLGPAPFGTSQAAYNALTPSQQQMVASVYGQGGIMQGYNPVSAFGRGPRGAIQNRIDNILARKAAKKSYGKTNLARLQQALADIDRGDSGDSGGSGGYGGTGGEGPSAVGSSGMLGGGV